MAVALGEDTTMTRAPHEIAVVLAVFDPDEQALSEQIASLAAQKGVTLHLSAVIADRTSGALVTGLAKRHGLAVELMLPDSPTQSFESFELGLSAALDAFPSADYVAFCDQDDVWAPDKLARSVTTLVTEGVGLAHTDAEVVGPDGTLVAPSLHRLERRLDPRHARDLLVENCVTGMTAVFTREVAEAALPFPRQAALFFHHDLWLALVAMQMGGIARVDEPLVAYRQHERNVVGAGRARGARYRMFTPSWYRHWGGTYFVAAYLAKSLYLRMEDMADRRGVQVDRQRLTVLRPFLSERGLGLRHCLDALRFACRGRRDLALHSMLFSAVRCARVFMAVRQTLFRGFLPALAEFDRRAFSIAPGAQPQGRTQAPVAASGPAKSAATYRDRRTELALPVRIDESLAPGVTIFVPSLNPSEVFAGIATALDIGLGLLARGHRVTFVATDLPIANPRVSRAFLASRSMGAGRGRSAELVCASSARDLVLARDETLVASAWWTAHICQQLRHEPALAGGRFYYLIQDFEPGFYPWGAEHAGAMQSYGFGATPIFNSQPLADYFFGQGVMAPSERPIVFQPAIDVSRYARSPRATSARRRIAFYGRPEVARNLFPMGIEALDRFLKAAAIGPDETELVSVGLRHEDILFSNGHRMRSLGKIPWPDYPGFLAGVDLGLSLMLSPHPSHPPIEMAAAGARVVTNRFEGKCLSTLTPAIRSVPPTATALAAALQEGWAAGPALAAERRFDLTPLGVPLSDAIDAVSKDIRAQQAPIRLRA